MVDREWGERLGWDSVQFSSVAQSCPTLCDPMNRSTPGLPVHHQLLICLLRNLYAGEEATVRTGPGTTDWFQIGKGVRQSCILSPCLFNLSAEYIMRNAGLRKHRLESRLPGEISITSDMQMTPPLWQKVKKN